MRTLCAFANTSGGILEVGRRVQKIAEAYKAWNKPSPFYEICPNEVMIGFHVEPSSIVGSTEKGTEKITNNQRIILNSILENPHITSEELSAIVGVKVNAIK
ncbi:MAG: hypothetical protein FWC26_03015 [Fibromonadales bacterium]|nr:hypothetical protein [Fibromonadales bacterium]